MLQESEIVGLIFYQTKKYGPISCLELALAFVKHEALRLV